MIKMAIAQEIKKIFFEGTAVYMSADFIDIAEAHSSSGKIELTSLQRFPITSGAEQGVDGIFDRVFSSGNETPYRVVVNVRNDQLILRRFAIREIPKKEIARAVMFEAQTHLPHPIDTLSYGFKTYKKRENFHEIVFVAQETKSINELIYYFTRKNILPAVIEPIPLLLSKLVELDSPEFSGACIIIHYEPRRKIVLCGSANKHPYLFREIALPYEKGPEDEGAYPTLGEIWEHVEKDVIYGINYMRKETSERVERIYISGFTRSGDEDRIASELGVPIKRPHFPFFTDAGPEKNDKYLPVLMLIHDALRKPSLNIAPQDVVRSDIYGVRSVFLQFFAGLGVIIALHAAFLGVNAWTSRNMSEITKKFKNYRDINPDNPGADVQLHKKFVVESALFCGDLMTKERFLTQKLDGLGRLLPPMSWVESITFSYDQSNIRSASFVIKGSILDSASSAIGANKILEAFKSDRQMMEGFKKASLSSVEKKIFSGKEVTEFEISLN